MCVTMKNKRANRILDTIHREWPMLFRELELSFCGLIIASVEAENVDKQAENGNAVSEERKKKRK